MTTPVIRQPPALPDIQSLSAEQKLELIELLWASLTNEQRESNLSLLQSSELTIAQQQLLDERDRQLQTGEAELLSWDDAKAMIVITD